MRVTFERAPPVPIHPALRSPHCGLCGSVSDRYLSGGDFRAPNWKALTMSVSPAVDKDTVIARARAAIENRTKYIESLFDAAQASADAREKVAEATRAAERANAEHVAAYKEAIDAGWTVAELTGSGLTAPTPPTGKKASKASAKRATGRTTARRRVGAENTAAAPDRHHDDDASSPAPDVSTEPQPSTAPAH